MADEITVDDTPTNGANPYIDSLVAGGAWIGATGGTVQINYSLASGTNLQVPSRGFAWTAAEKAAVLAALNSWSAVADVAFIDIASTPAADTADIHIWNINGNDMANGLGESSASLGLSEEPGFSDSGTFDVWFNREGDGWTVPGGLQKGGYAFITLVHELGHALGLAHPHDGFPTSPDPTKFPGVDSPGSLGDFNLNQGIFTVMTYNDGWQTQYPSHTATAGNFAFGWQSGPMALDIAAIQTLYGKNMNTATGDNLYSLPIANTAGTGWSCIWDAGGADTISAETANAGSTITLTAAALTGAFAGGIPCFVDGVIGGFTIANGVTIENAIGSRFNDTLSGNAADNYISGLTGDDVLSGGAGADYLEGGDGNDTVSYYRQGGAVASLIADAKMAGSAAGDSLFQIENIIGSRKGDDVLTGNSDDNVLNGSGGDDRLSGGEGTDTLKGGSGNDTLMGDDGEDILQGGSGRDIASYYHSPGVVASLSNPGLNLSWADGDSFDSIEGLMGSNSGADQLFGDSDANFLWGYGGNDKLAGGSGKDSLTGGKGKDLLYGGSGADRLFYTSVQDCGDTINRFDSGDKLYFKMSEFGGNKMKSFGAANFVARASHTAKDRNDYFLFDTTDHSLWFDIDGSGSKSAVEVATFTGGGAPAADDILFY